MVCAQPGCPNLQPCTLHGRKPQAPANQRGYGAGWRRVRNGFLAAHPVCVGNGTGQHHPKCDGVATIPDHHPQTRAELVAMGVADPDAWCYLVPRSAACHRSKTLRFDGGYGNPRRSNTFRSNT